MNYGKSVYTDVHTDKLYPLTLTVLVIYFINNFCPMFYRCYNVTQEYIRFENNFYACLFQKCLKT